MPDELVKCFGNLPLFLAFFIICVAALLFVHFPVTETKGRSREEIQNDLRQRAALGA
jgi:SP family sugar:H+ symporter-like MFS transporter